VEDYFETGHKKRPLDFKIGLLLIISIKIFNIFLITLTVINSKEYSLKKFQLPESFFPTTLVLNILGLLGLFMIYNFKKIGFYFFIGDIVIQLLMQRYYGYIDTDIIFQLFVLFLVGIGLVPKWKEFS